MQNRVDIHEKRNFQKENGENGDIIVICRHIHAHTHKTKESWDVVKIVAASLPKKASARPCPPSLDHDAT